METSSILSADILDILFEGRNKTYGAYELRKTYDKRIAYALAGTFFLCLIFIVSSILANGKKKLLQQDIVTSIDLMDVKQPEPPQPKIPPPPKVDPPKVEIAKFTPPKIVPDEQVKPEEEIKEQQVLDDTKIGAINQEGTKEDVIAPPVESIGAAVEAPKVDKDIDLPFTTVQIQAQFTGGFDAWRKYLERNLNKDLPSENGAPEGSYTVTVSFLVNREGVISDVKAENDPGYGTKAEAVRVIQKSPNWIPAVQNGRYVIYRQKQNITFKVSVE